MTAQTNPGTDGGKTDELKQRAEELAAAEKQPDPAPAAAEPEERYDPIEALKRLEEKMDRIIKRFM